MVTTSVRKGYLLRLVGRKLNEQQLEEALHQIKAPIDSVEGDELNIEVTGDRPDLLSAEGIARALKGYLGIEKGIPPERFERGKFVLHADKSVKNVREFIVAAVVEGAALADDDLKDLIQIQEKLTLTHGRKRKKVAIGLHNMEPLVWPFYYKAVEPESVSFVPLGKSEKMNLRQIVEKHEKGIDYSCCLDGLSKYPVIFDSRNQVLSFPPIINGILTELGTGTKSIFIDITGTDFHACNTALNILCQDFADRGAKVCAVEIKYPEKTVITPETAPEKMDLDVEYANKLLGTSLPAEKIISALGKQRISAKIKNAAVIECHIPRYRADFMHQVDLIEDVALGYGYNNFEPKAPSVFTKGAVSQRTKFIDLISDLMIGAGFVQINTPILTNQKLADKTNGEEKLIKIKNPISEEYENTRYSLLPQLIETLSKNTHNTYPQKLFEIGYTAKADPESDTSTRNDLHLAAIFADTGANLAELSGTLLELLRHLRVEYNLSKSRLKTYIPGRQAVIFAKMGNDAHEIARIGGIHPAVLDNFKLEMPAVGMEIDLEKVISK
ncbi:MAG: phenylalanine--tRNA ligase subunit beta [Candidatus Micrarchaeota archaeon]